MEQSAPETFHTPDWTHDAVFYQIFPDRFAMSPAVPKPSNLEAWDAVPTGHGFKGGDLVGVAGHLDYLQDLGITAIYFTPIFQSTANHRYHTYDYWRVDPLLGGNAAFGGLLQEAHRRGMRVVVDGVFNHASRGFFQFNDILENGGESPYIDWFGIQHWPLNPYGPGSEPPGYDCWWGLPALPKFNTNTPAVREFLWSVAEFWISEGADGWRLDVPNEIDDDEFWREFRRRVKRANGDAYIVGEIWGDASRWLQGDQFDAVMNYLFTRACIGFFAGTGTGIDEDMIVGTGLSSIDPVDAPQFAGIVESILHLYPWSATLAQLNLLGSHDTPRFLTIAKEDTSALRLATLFQMTYPGAPCVYYGDEIGMLGGRDPLNRGGFPWDTSRWNHELRTYFAECIRLRRTHAVLRRGSYGTVRADGNLYVFCRQLENQVAYIALNASSRSTLVDVSLPEGLGNVHVAEEWQGGGHTLSDRTIRDWKLPPRSGSVIVADMSS